jgi:hypothetical protein
MRSLKHIVLNSVLKRDYSGQSPVWVPRYAFKNIVMILLSLELP